MSRSIRESWDEIVASALVGTARRVARRRSAGGIPERPLDVTLTAIDAKAETPEWTLLAAAATVAAYRKVGALPAKETRPLSEPAPTDDIPHCSWQSGRDLGVIMERKGYSEALPEWLAAVALAGLRVRDENLPDLLDLGRFRSVDRTAIAAILGKRGRWLAAQNRDWVYILRDVESDLDDAEARWQTEGRDSRIALIRQVRGAEPDRARALVDSTWKVDSPADRAAFLEAFGVGLSMADEPFLEAALDDRRAEVRRTAADLLARIPGSRLIGRMVDRLTTLVRISGENPSHATETDVAESRLVRRMVGGLASLVHSSGKPSPTIEVDLPAGCTREMARDGISAKVPGLGEKAGWLAQMIAAVPPSHWEQVSGISPDRLIVGASATEWGAALLGAWMVATVNHRDPSWSRAFLLSGIDHQVTPPRPIRYPDLLQILPEADRQEMIVTVVESPARFAGNTFWLEHLGNPWGDRLARAILEFLEGFVEKMDGISISAASRIIQLAATQMPTQFADEFDRRIRPKLEARACHRLEELDTALEILRFRRAMIEELSR